MLKHLLLLIILFRNIKAEIYPILTYDIPEIYIKNANLVDENNTRISLNGINFDYDKLTIQHIKYFKLNGFNTIRFEYYKNKNFIWSIKSCLEMGMYVIINYYENIISWEEITKIDKYYRRILLNTNKIIMNYPLYIISDAYVKYDHRFIFGTSITNKTNITKLEDKIGYLRTKYPIIIINFNFKFEDIDFMRSLALWLKEKDIDNIILWGIQYDLFLF